MHDINQDSAESLADPELDHVPPPWQRSEQSQRCGCQQLRREPPLLTDLAHQRLPRLLDGYATMEG